MPLVSFLLKPGLCYITQEYVENVGDIGTSVSPIRDPVLQITQVFKDLTSTNQNTEVHMHVKPKPSTCTQAFLHVDQALLLHLHTFIFFTFICSHHVSLFAICSAKFTRDLAIIFIFGKPPSTWKINSIPCLGIFNGYLKIKSVQHNKIKTYCQIELQKIHGTLKYTTCCMYIYICLDL